MTDNVKITTIIRHNMEWKITDVCQACGMNTLYVVESGETRCLIGCYRCLYVPIEEVAS